MLRHSLTNFEIQKYDQNEPKINGVFSRKNLSKIKDRAYLINLDEFESIGTHWVVFYVNGNIGRASYDVIYFDSFRVEHISKENETFTWNKNFITNVYRIQVYDSIMCGYFSIAFIDFMLEGKSL